jgi:hypothetical protein
MSRDLHGTADFERQLHTLLEESVRRVGGRPRSRLNQARQAAIAEAERRSHWPVPLRALEWLRPRALWMPATGAVAAAVLVALVHWPHAPQGYPAIEANHTTVEDLDLLADRDGMDLMQGGGDGQFYEWAVAQADEDGQPAAPGGSVRGKTRGGQGAGADTKQNSG